MAKNIVLCSEGTGQVGEKYRISVTPNGEKWKNESIPSSPDGFDDWLYDLHPVMIVAIPLRRHL